MRWLRMAVLFAVVLLWGMIERSLGFAPLVGLSLGACVACAFELRLGVSLLSGSFMLAAGEWVMGLPVGYVGCQTTGLRVPRQTGSSY